MANCEHKDWLFIALLEVRSDETVLLFYSKDRNLYYITYFCIKVEFTVTTTTLINLDKLKIRRFSYRSELISVKLRTTRK